MKSACIFWASLTPLSLQHVTLAHASSARDANEIPSWEVIGTTGADAVELRDRVEEVKFLSRAQTDDPISARCVRGSSRVRTNIVGAAVMFVSAAATRFAQH
jgi:hypothetical protein